MTDPVPSTPYAPIGDEPSGAATLLRRVIPIALIALVAISFFAPETLRRLVPGLAMDPNAVRFAAMVLLFVFVATASLRQTRRRNETRRALFLAFASSAGGRVVDGPRRVTASGWEGGTSVAYEIQGRPVRLTSNQGRESVYAYRLAADIVLRRDFQFQVVPGGKAMRFVLSKTFLLPTMTIAARSAGSARVRIGSSATVVGAGPGLTPELLVQRMRFLADDPVTTGDPEFDRAYLVKASDRDAAREVVTDPSVRAAFQTLTKEGRGFQLGAECEGAGGPGQLVVTVSAELTPTLVPAMDAALRATLAALARLDLIEGGARGAA